MSAPRGVGCQVSGGEGGQERPQGLLAFGVYAYALELFEGVAEDMSLLAQHFVLQRLVSQQLASADSVCANIEEGHGRETRKEYTRYLVIARGSARETEGRYRRSGRWLPADAVAKGADGYGRLVGMLSRSITTLSRPGSRA